MSAACRTTERAAGRRRPDRARGPLLASARVVRERDLPVAAGRAAAAGAPAERSALLERVDRCARGGAAPAPRRALLGGGARRAVRARHAWCLQVAMKRRAGGAVGVGGGRRRRRGVRALPARGGRLRGRAPRDQTRERGPLRRCGERSARCGQSSSPPTRRMTMRSSSTATSTGRCPAQCSA